MLAELGTQITNIYAWSCCGVSCVRHSPDCHVEDVAAHWGGHRHVAEALPGHNDAGDEVGDGGARRQECQAHHLRTEEVLFFNFVSGVEH